MYFSHLVVLDGELRPLGSQQERLRLLELFLLEGESRLSDEHIRHRVGIVFLCHALRRVPVLVVNVPANTHRVNTRQVVINGDFFFNFFFDFIFFLIFFLILFLIFFFF